MNTNVVTVVVAVLVAGGFVYGCQSCGGSDSREVARLKQELEEVKKQQPEVKSSDRPSPSQGDNHAGSVPTPTPVAAEETKESCTLEHAINLHPAEHEEMEERNQSRQEWFDAEVARLKAISAEAKKLPDPPKGLTNLPTANVEIEDRYYAAEASFIEWSKKCSLYTRAEGKELKYSWAFGGDWREASVFAAQSLKDLADSSDEQQTRADRDGESYTFLVHDSIPGGYVVAKVAAAIAFPIINTDGPTARAFEAWAINQAEKQVLKRSAQDKRMRLLLSDLWEASKTDFRKFKEEVKAAEEETEEGKPSDGYSYYKNQNHLVGILFREWSKPGRGDAFILRLRVFMVKIAAARDYLVAEDWAKDLRTQLMKGAKGFSAATYLAELDKIINGE